MKNESVLCIPLTRFKELLGNATGFIESTRRFNELMRLEHMQFLSRDEVETDPNWLQLIPYVILTHKESIFYYTRGSTGGEKRLHSLKSVGIGGHINVDDTLKGGHPYYNGMSREIHEEVQTAPYQEILFGLIYDPSTPVGSVHLGIVHQFELTQPVATPREKEISEAGFLPVKELVVSEFENWSQLVIENIRKYS